MLTRIHSTSFGVTAFNPTVAQSDLRGGRFDAVPGDHYPFLYAADRDTTAVSEALLRDLPIDERGARLLPRVRLSHVSIGWLRTTLDVELVGLRSGAELAAVGQDSWLTSSSAADYANTRRWASAIRLWAPWGARPDVALTPGARRLRVRLLRRPLSGGLLRGGDGRAACAPQRPESRYRRRASLRRRDSGVLPCRHRVSVRPDATWPRVSGAWPASCSAASGGGSSITQGPRVAEQGRLRSPHPAPGFMSRPTG